MSLEIAQATINWIPSYRVIANRFPAINFFERVAADPADWDLLCAVEKLTDPSAEPGDLSMLQIEDRLAGTGCGRILPSFTFYDPLGTRFSDDSFGAYYASFDLETAILETVHHRTIFMRATNQPAQDLDQLLILADINGMMHDIRGMQSAFANVYSLVDYSESQRFASALRIANSNGLAFNSVRNPTGECVAVWRARVISNAREEKHISYRWNGARITGYYDKENYRSL
jgi:hypothetical protein